MQCHQITRFILPDMNCPNDSHDFDEKSYKNGKNVSSESNHDRKLDAVLRGADVPNDSLFIKEIGENISEEIFSDDS